MILVPDTTSDPMSTGTLGEHAQRLEQRHARHAADHGDHHGARDRHPQDAHVPAVAHGGAEYAIAVAAADRRERARPVVESDTAVNEFIPGPRRPNRESGGPQPILTPSSPIVAPKYGPAAADSPIATDRRNTAPVTAQSSGMGENVLGRPAREIEPRPGRAGSGNRPPPARPAFARQHGVELLLQRMQVQHVGAA